MPDILELQQSFYKNLFIKNKKLDFISSDCKDGRFQVYQNTIFETLTSALKITFPGVWQLIGDSCAHAMAYRYVQVQANLPTTGCLDDWGEFFPFFLAKQPELKHLKYLGDYAKFEWLGFKASMAGEQTALAPDVLLQLSEQELSASKLELKSSMCLMKSDYNLKEICRLIMQEDNYILSDSEVIQKSYILITKDNYKVKTFWLKSDIWIFIDYISSNKPLGVAVELTMQLSANFNLIQALSFLLTNNLVVKVA